MLHVNGESTELSDNLQMLFREILDAMESESGLGLRSSSLLADGGMSQNGLLMQVQSDLLGIPVLRPAMAETTALGAAIAGMGKRTLRSRRTIDPPSKLAKKADSSTNQTSNVRGPFVISSPNSI